MGLFQAFFAGGITEHEGNFLVHGPVGAPQVFLDEHDTLAASTQLPSYRASYAPRVANRRSTSLQPLLQLRVLGLCLHQDRDVGVGVLPQREEVLIGGAGFGGVARCREGAGEAKTSEGTDR